MLRPGVLLAPLVSPTLTGSGDVTLGAFAKVVTQPQRPIDYTLGRAVRAADLPSAGAGRLLAATHIGHKSLIFGHTVLDVDIWHVCVVIRWATPIRSSRSTYRGIAVRGANLQNPSRSVRNSGPQIEMSNVSANPISLGVPTS